MSRFWSRLCDVLVVDLAEWAQAPGRPWPQLDDPTKPLRLWDVPAGLVKPILDKVLLYFDPGTEVRSVCLSLVRPGTYHPMHVDSEPGTFVTRVHVPLVTNPGCWFAWEADGFKVRFAVGGAYTFNTQERHAFANEGDADRIHLCFDLWKAR